MKTLRTHKKVYPLIRIAMGVSLWLILSLSLAIAAVNLDLRFPGSTILQSQMNGWMSPASGSMDIATPTNPCIRVTSTTSTQYFIPTKTPAEWTAFQAHLPSGVTTAPCVGATTANSKGMHCDIGGSWGWRDARVGNGDVFGAPPYLFGRVNYSGLWVYYIFMMDGSPETWSTIDTTTNLDSMLCKNGKTPFQIGENGITSCPPWAVQHGGGCYYGNTDPRRPAECSSSDPSDDCCFFMCDDPLPPTAGVCGSANGSGMTSYPTTNHCSTGNRTNIDTVGSDWAFNWSCSGINGGATTLCSANRLTYAWIAPTTWWACSASCGGGAQSRVVSCQRSDGVVVADTFCAGVKPATIQSCNTQACVTVSDCSIQWYALPAWPTNDTELLPWQTRNFAGRGFTYIGANLIKVGNNFTCPAVAPPPPPVPVNGVCGAANGTGSMTYPTSGYCATGTKADIDTTGTDGSYNWSCSGTNSGTTASCSANKLYTYSWIAPTTWWACSASCGGGAQSRVVSCQRSDGVVVADTFCAGVKPATIQSCNTQACTTPSTCSWSQNSGAPECGNAPLVDPQTPENFTTVLWACSLSNSGQIRTYRMDEELCGTRRNTWEASCRCTPIAPPPLPSIPLCGSRNTCISGGIPSNIRIIGVSNQTIGLTHLWTCSLSGYNDRSCLDGPYCYKRNMFWINVWAPCF